MNVLVFVTVLLGLLSVSNAQREDEFTTITLTDHNNFTVNGFTTSPWYEYEGSGEHWRLLDNGIYGYVTNEGQGWYVDYQNEASVETTFHLHGQSPAPYLDGVAFLGGSPLEPGRSARVTYPFFEEDSEGTYWVHSHVGYQVAYGAFAPILILGRPPSTYPYADQLNSARDVMIYVEDFCPYVTSGQTVAEQRSCNWNQVLGILRDTVGQESGEDYICPGAAPHPYRDVYWQEYLVNKKPINDPAQIQVRPGQWLRIRILAATTMTHFLIEFPFELDCIAADGQLIFPYRNRTFWIAAAQRLDFMWRVPENGGAWPIVFHGEDNFENQYGGIILHTRRFRNVRQIAPEFLQGTPPGLMAHDTEIALRSYFPLEERPVDRFLYLNITRAFGNRLNGNLYFLTSFATFAPNPSPLLVAYGERVRIRMNNFGPVNHPMHLHGHRFQITAVDDIPIAGAIRDTALVSGGCRSLEFDFDAVNPGIWAFHCHMHIHFATGMLTTLEYI